MFDELIVVILFDILLRHLFNLNLLTLFVKRRLPIDFIFLDTHLTYTDFFFMSQQRKLHDILQSCTIQLPHVFDRLVIALHHVWIEWSARATLQLKSSIIKGAYFTSPIALSFRLDVFFPGLMYLILKLVSVSQNSFFTIKREHPL